MLGIVNINLFIIKNTDVLGLMNTWRYEERSEKSFLYLYEMSQANDIFTIHLHGKMNIMKKLQLYAQLSLAKLQNYFLQTRDLIKKSFENPAGEWNPLEVLQ